MTPSEWDEETKRAVREKIRMEEEKMRVVKRSERPPVRWTRYDRLVARAVKIKLD